MSSEETSSPLPEEAIESVAASWLAQREEGFTPDQEAEFLRWRLVDPRHGAAVDRLEETCALLERLPLLRGDPRIEKASSSLENMRAVPITPRKKGPIYRSTWAWGSIAAAAACLAILVSVARFTEQEPKPMSYATEPTGYQRVLLPDSSVAQLNGGTHLDVVYSKHERLVQLGGGEAHFNVAKDAARPFIVTAQHYHVIAVGTAFNVRISGENVDILVTEGVVRIEKDDSAGAPIVVAAGERALVGRNASGVVARLDPEQTRAALAWEQQQMIFVEAPLSEMIKRFNARNSVQLELGDDSIGSRVVGGTFKMDDVETFVRLLENSSDMAVERKPDGRIVLRGANRPGN